MLEYLMNGFFMSRDSFPVHEMWSNVEMARMAIGLGTRLRAGS